MDRRLGLPGLLVLAVGLGGCFSSKNAPQQPDAGFDGALGDIFDSGTDGASGLAGVDAVFRERGHRHGDGNDLPGEHGQHLGDGRRPRQAVALESRLPLDVVAVHQRRGGGQLDRDGGGRLDHRRLQLQQRRAVRRCVHVHDHHPNLDVVGVCSATTQTITILAGDSC
jgi:hypothetical protein